MPATSRSAPRSTPSTLRWVLLAALGLGFWAMWDSALLWPLKVLVVLFHELSHAAAAVLTGGRVLEIHVAPNQSGHAITAGGSPLLIMNAGYLGSMSWGLALLWVARRPRAAPKVAMMLALILAGVTLVYVRPIVSFGFLFSLAVAGGLGATTRLASADVVAFCLRAIGVFSIVYVMAFDILGDVFGAPADAVTDATLLAAYTGIPSLVWGVTWLVLGCGLLFVLRKRLV